MLWVNRQKQHLCQEPELLSYRLPKINIIIDMTDIRTSVMLNIVSMPRTMFYVPIGEWVSEGRLCGPITFANDDIMAYQWKKLRSMRPLRSMIHSACREILLEVLT